MHGATKKKGYQELIYFFNGELLFTLEKKELSMFIFLFNLTMVVLKSYRNKR